MNIVLVGKTGSGKTSLCNWICQNLRYEKLITYTSRPPRNGEVDKVDYNFVNGDFFNYADLYLVTEHNGYKYGIGRLQLENADEKVLIVDPYGWAEIDEYFNHPNEKYVSFLVDVPSEERYKRCCDRGDSPMMLAIRMADEEKEFDGVKTNFVVDNSDGKFENAIISILEGVKEAKDCLLQNSTK